MIKTTKLNKCLHFILPMIGISHHQYKSKIINCYMGDIKYRPNLSNYHIFLLTAERDENLELNLAYKEHYLVPEGIMYVFKISSDLEEDYLKFILGKYSEFSGDYKRMILTLLPFNYQQTNVFKVIMKSTEAKKLIEDRIGCSIGDQEVMSVPNMDEEIYG